MWKLKSISKIRFNLNKPMSNSLAIRVTCYSSYKSVVCEYKVKN